MTEIPKLMLDHHTWPPSFKVRRHRLAKRIKLRMTQSSGLEITVPPRFNLQELPAILEEHKAWIVKHLSLQPTPINEIFPDKITFHAMEESWDIKLVACNAKFEIICKPTSELVFVGPTEDTQLCKSKLTNWVKERAKGYISSELDNLSQITGLVYSRLIVRDQKTLWGSCTFNKSISLNYKLIFLPKELLRHVIIHELCHTEYLNHSSRFWNLVATHDPEWRTHKEKLRRAGCYIPRWII